jgi:acetolactate synthase-1/2/3 large subunit
MQTEGRSIAGVEFHDTDFVRVAQGFGAHAERIDDPVDLGPALRAGKESDRPTVLDVRIDREQGMESQLQSSFYASVGGLHE